MIQGGGFEADGTQKQSPYGSIDLEINPEVHHVDGAIAMARTSDPNSATSQFFINDEAQPSLEPGGVDQYGYAAFGVVIEGMDIVREIASVGTTVKNGMSDWPIDDVIINSITIENQ
jgi:peptidyl-prolyl cis-trans isomerase A (cyclophilin A)